MAVKNFCFILLWGVSSSIINAQPSIPYPAKNIYGDQLGHLYVVTPNNILIKLDAGGKELFRYENHLLGELQNFDASDPLNLLLFYPEFQSIVLLDRTLSLSARIDLSDKNFFQVSAAASSADKKIWLYDATDFNLKKMDATGKILTRSGDLNLLTGKKIQVQRILVDRNSVMAFVGEPGILLFDAFGQYQRFISTNGSEFITLYQNRMVVKTKEQWMVYDPLSFQWEALALPDDMQAAEEIIFYDHQVVYKTGEQVFIRKLR